MARSSALQTDPIATLEVALVVKTYPQQETAMNQPDRFTSRYPQRNAVVILLLMLLASAWADFGTKVSP